MFRCSRVRGRTGATLEGTGSGCPAIPESKRQPVDRVFPRGIDRGVIERCRAAGQYSRDRAQFRVSMERGAPRSAVLRSKFGVLRIVNGSVQTADDDCRIISQVGQYGELQCWCGPKSSRAIPQSAGLTLQEEVCLKTLKSFAQARPNRAEHHRSGRIARVINCSYRAVTNWQRVIAHLRKSVLEPRRRSLRGSMLTRPRLAGWERGEREPTGSFASLRRSYSSPLCPIAVLGRAT